MAKKFETLKNTKTCEVCGWETEGPFHRYCKIHSNLVPAQSFWEEKSSAQNFYSEDFDICFEDIGW